jgi:DNA-binding transcriptional regulator YiaG
MKKKIKKGQTSTLFFEDPDIKKIMADTKRKANIDVKFRHLHFLEDIERIRKAEGLSQTQLSKLTKISQEEISRIESGKRNVTFERYFNILGALGYEPEIKYHKILNTSKTKEHFIQAHKCKPTLAIEAHR